ncbi:hypothetical protein AXK59_09990 [Tsukamurella tyrosinosolvens]|nr:hypothetical protein AXK59_09990 [Tsukamurella tyrosinosolvens]KZL95653.1 hypothetical protein AXX05_21080 [Tsukamurella tyrosinosolvens]
MLPISESQFVTEVHRWSSESSHDFRLIKTRLHQVCNVVVGAGEPHRWRSDEGEVAHRGAAGSVSECDPGAGGVGEDVDFVEPEHFAYRFEVFALVPPWRGQTACCRCSPGVHDGERTTSPPGSYVTEIGGVAYSASGQHQNRVSDTITHKLEVDIGT